MRAGARACGVAIAARCHDAYAPAIRFQFVETQILFVYHARARVRVRGAYQTSQRGESWVVSKDERTVSGRYDCARAYVRRSVLFNKKIRTDPSSSARATSPYLLPTFWELSTRKCTNLKKKAERVEGLVEGEG